MNQIPICEPLPGTNELSESKITAKNNVSFSLLHSTKDLYTLSVIYSKTRFKIWFCCSSFRQSNGEPCDISISHTLFLSPLSSAAIKARIRLQPGKSNNFSRGVIHRYLHVKCSATIPKVLCCQHSTLFANE